MLIKLTYLNPTNGNKKAFLFHIEEIKSVKTVFVAATGKKMTKLIERNGQHFNVFETPKEIMDIQMKVINGTYDINADEWVDSDDMEDVVNDAFNDVNYNTVEPRISLKKPTFRKNRHEATQQERW